MATRILPSGLLLLLLFGRAQAWGGRIHRFIAYQALKSVWRELPVSPRQAWAILQDASVAPDLKGPGRLPPSAHVYHPPGLTHTSLRGQAPNRVQSLVWKLTGGEPSDREFVYELGRLSHLVGDLAQPLHTDGGAKHPREKRVHARYERDVDRLGPRGTSIGKAPDLGGGSWSSRVQQLARLSHGGYCPILDAYDRNGGYRDVADLTQKQIDTAISVTAELWRYVLARRGRATYTCRFAAWMSYFLILWALMYFRRRGPVRREASRWPGGGSSHQTVSLC